MAYDIKEIYNESHCEQENTEERLDAMVSEIRRLGEENRRLSEENRALREEVTLGRLRGDSFATTATATSGPGLDISPGHASEVPEYALALLKALPFSFTFTELFAVADQQGVTGTEAKRYLKLFLESRLLVQKGSRIEKAAETGGLPPPLRLPYR